MTTPDDGDLQVPDTDPSAVLARDPLALDSNAFGPWDD